MSKPAAKGTSIRIGVGGWTYEPWRGTFYPSRHPQKSELSFASRKLTTLEVNGTYYGSQEPQTFARWHDETPDDFVFALKGPRYATNRRILAGAGASIERFFASGVLLLRDKLGPINWQLLPTKTFVAADLEAFLKLLPNRLEGRPIRHAIEVRHDSFRNAEFAAMARTHDVAIVIAGDSDYPQINDVTAPFVYVRIMGTDETKPQGYAEADVDRWAARARAWASGGSPKGLDHVGAPPQPARSREVFIYVIGGFKERNPAAAMALIERLDQPRPRTRSATRST